MPSSSVFCGSGASSGSSSVTLSAAVNFIAPANKQRRKTAEMLSTLKKGDKVLTSGGIYGTVQGVEAEVVYLKIAENVKVKVARSAITGITTGDAAE